jgi:hypothetical protein
MLTPTRTAHRVLLPATLLLAAFAATPAVQSQQPANHAKANAAPAPTPGDDDSATQQQLLKLLRLSPTLTTVVVRDPSLLSDQPYVDRNSPELAQFLKAHPEVARNPSFYLFSHLYAGHGRSEQALEQKIWPDLAPTPQQNWQPQQAQQEPRRPDYSEMVGFIAAAIAFACILGTLLWLIRMLLENRRWNRIFKLQTEVHTRLIERFGNNQELLTYMDTEAGKRFLEAAPIPIDFDHGQQRLPNAISKVLMSLQIGIVLTLLGAGMVALRHSVPDLAIPLLVFGMILLMPGLGFIITAAITWSLAGRLGMMPQPPSASQPDGSQRQ